MIAAVKPQGVGAHALLYLVGAIHWVAFLNFGNIPFGLYDWKQEYFYYSVLKDSVTAGIVPFHLSESMHATERFLAIPLTVLAPHVVLLRWLPIRFFVILHTLLFYSIGYLGGMLLKKKYRLSWPSFLVFFVLFNFNGYLTSHLAVGHTVWWTGYFFLPWFFLAALEWVEHGPSVRCALGMSLAIFGASLPGSFHFCSWCMIFICLLGLRKSGWLKYTGLVAVASGALMAYRLVPALVAFERLKHGHPVGYPGLQHLVAAFVSLRSPQHPTVNAMGWWEYDMYVGVIGLGILLAFGVMSLMGRIRSHAGESRYSRLDLPLVGMALLSYGEVYWWVLSDIPMLAVERVVTRLLILPLVLLAMLASIRLEALRKSMSGSRGWTWMAAGMALLLAADLARHSWIWRLAALAEATPHSWVLPVVPVIVNRPDPIYIASVIGGMAVTLAALAGCGWLWWKNWEVRSTPGWR